MKDSVSLLPAGEVARCSLLGTTAMIFDPQGPLDVEMQRRIWDLSDRAATWPETAEAVPGVTNLMLIFERPPAEPEEIAARLLRAWEAGSNSPRQGRHMDVPIIYGGDGGPHLADVAAQTGLSIDEVVEIHAAPLYTVFAIGSHPGYCYLGGLDARLFVPRREVPLLSIPKGSLSVAGMQTGVAASAGPSGWHTIGWSGIDFFDPERVPPSLLHPGDTMRFHVEKVIR